MFRSGIVPGRCKCGKAEEQRTRGPAQRLRAARPWCISALRHEAQPGDPLFLSDRDRAFSPRAIQTLLQRLARRAKIAHLHVTPHLLRHTFALNYLRQNPGKLVQLANLLGHESLDTTAIYTQPSGEELAEDLERSRLNVYG